MPPLAWRAKSAGEWPAEWPVEWWEWARQPEGVIVVIKPSLADAGDEDADVRQYGMENNQFPQQSTADFWYDEAQFESYRRLGEHSAYKVFGNVPKDPKVAKPFEHFWDHERSWNSDEVKEAFEKLRDEVSAKGGKKQRPPGGAGSPPSR